MSYGRHNLTIKERLSEVWTLTITPHSQAEQICLTIPKMVVYLFLLAVLFYSGYVTLNMKINFDEYYSSKEATRILELTRLENEKLRSEIVKLAKETENLQDDLLALQQQGQRIQCMMSEDMIVGSQFPYLGEQRILLAYTSGDMDAGGRGGSTSYLLSQDAFCLIQSMKQDIKVLRETIPVQHKEMGNLEETVKEFTAVLAATPSIWPLIDNGSGWISSNFGSRRDPFTGKQAFHSGIDIGIWSGTPVVATADGIVSFSGEKAGYGNVVDIDHGYGYQTTYAHNQKLIVHNGQRVKRGEVIAYSGNTGRSTAPHLHYEVKVNGVPHDPRKYLY